MISPETEELIQARWAVSIPPQYRCRGHLRWPDYAGIRQPWPGEALAERWLELLGSHIRADQRIVSKAGVKKKTRQAGVLMAA